jgi:nicotinate-nucleotide adenylyltransferase
MGTGLFFGSFNPVHRGHEMMVASFLRNEMIEDLWLILTPSPPHKHTADLASYADRWNMLELVFSDDKNVLLSDLEQRLPSPHYTVRTLSYLKNSYPDRPFYLCIGGDTLQSLSTWYEFEKIAPKAELLVAERPGIPLRPPPELSTFVVHFCEHDPQGVSSTSIRKKISAGIAPGPDELTPSVLGYICQNGLYGWKDTD